MFARPLPVALAACAVFPACQSMSEGILAVEARAILYEDSQIDDFDAASNFGDDNVDLTGYGIEAAFMTPILDFIGGIDQREYEDEKATELRLGLRRRFLELWRVHPYIAADLRYGFDLDTGTDEADFTGWDAGIGALLDVTDHFFLDFRLVYEATGDDIDVAGEDTSIDGVVGTFGLGWSF